VQSSDRVRQTISLLLQSVRPIHFIFGDNS